MNRGFDWETLVAVLTLMMLVLLAAMVFVVGVSNAA